ncbi:MAG: hypothetical protein U1E70_19685 [Acetobacteraceae bacterium]|nr:hypothetical protein [Pseudomonadota bacterium]
MKRLPPPRLLPVTISTMALLLAVKGGMLTAALLTDGVVGGTPVVTLAKAADHGATPSKRDPPAPTKHGGPQAPPLSPPPPDGPSPDAIAKGPPPPVITESEKALLQDLRQRRQELDAREAAAATREAVLGASQKKLEERVSELQALRRSLEDLEAARQQKQEAGWQGLVKVYEAMKPREAGTIFNDLSMPVLLQVLDRMKDAKAAAVLAAMNPEKARDVTAELAQMRLNRTSVPGQPAFPAPSATGPPVSSAAPAPVQPKPPGQATRTGTPGR